MIYFVSGESYQAEQFVQQLKAKKMQEGFECYFFDSEEEIEKSIFKLLDSPSLFNKNKIILARVSDYEFFEILAEKYKKRAREDTVVFFAPSLKKPRAVSSDSGISLHHFTMLKGESLKQFILKECNDRGVKLNNEVLNQFLSQERSLTDLFCIVNEIEKIYLAKERYQEVITFEKIESPFELTNALARKKRAEALKIFESEFEKGAKPVDVMSRVLWQIRVLIIVATYNLQLTTYNLQFHPFVIQKARQALRLFSLSELKELYVNAISLYEQLISSSLPSRLLLSRFFWRL